MYQVAYVSVAPEIVMSFNCAIMIRPFVVDEIIIYSLEAARALWVRRPLTRGLPTARFPPGRF
jgi:hypothetical protein